MYKVLLTLAIVFAITSSYLVVRSISQVSPEPVVDSQEVTLGVQTSAFEELKTPMFFAPVLLKLSEDSADLEVEDVGVASDGQLMVPSKWENVGWYENGAKPGEKGNVIIDGHYDTNTGKPAAFSGLKNLNVDDTVTITDELGRTFSYRVFEKFYVGISDPDRVRVFDDTPEPILTMITCGGVWDPVANTYDRRLVVKGTLVSTSMLVSSVK